MVFFETDAALVRAFQAGDKEAFDKLVLRYQDKVFHMCLRFLTDYEEANDSAQEIFVKVYLSLKRFRGDATFSTWLYRITVNTCKNKVKSFRYRFKSVSVPLGDVHESEKRNSAIDIADDSPSPMGCLETREKEMLIQHAINTLPISQKTVILLRHIEGLSYEQIAEATGFNPGTVKSKLARARLHLREQLKGVL